MKIAQTNVNHCRAAQDLCLQTMAERGVNALIISEPYNVPSHPFWFTDTSGTVAIVTRSTGTGDDPRPPVLMEQGRDYVAASWKNITLIGGYFSPNRSIVDFRQYLTDIERFINGLPAGPVLLLGDFNAKSPAWSSRDVNPRGLELSDWITSSGLFIVNTGNVATCVRWQGTSIIDLTFANSHACRIIRGWQVFTEVETLLDHRWIEFEVNADVNGRRSLQTTRDSNNNKWNAKKIDTDMLAAMSIATSWGQSGGWTAEEGADWLRTAMTSICDASMRRAGDRQDKLAAYWWTQEIADLRQICIRNRRKYARERRKVNKNPILIENARVAYSESRGELRKAIGKAKAEALA